MKIKNIDIINHLNALHELSDVELPVRLIYAIKKNHRRLVTEYSDYDEQRKALKDKYKGNTKSEEYGKELRELLDIEVDVEFHKVKEDVFETGDFSITARQLEALEFMIEIE